MPEGLSSIAPATRRRPVRNQPTALTGAAAHRGDFTAETCRTYQYDLAARGLQTSSIRVRLATLASFGKWAVRRGRITRNPVDVSTRPRRKARLPRVPRWATVERLLTECVQLREKALVALMCYGGLRRSEIVALGIADVATGLDLRRGQGKGGAEAAVPLPEVAQRVLGNTSRRSGPEPWRPSRLSYLASRRRAGRLSKGA